MYFYIDNFLPDIQFKELNERMLWRFKPTIRQDAITIRNRNSHPVRIRTSSDNNDYTEAAMILGKMVPDVVAKVKNFLENEHKFVNCMASSIWFQYHSQEQTLSQHYDDGHIRGKKPNQCFTSFVYTHNIWEDNYGGELCFETGSILPKSNRLVIYSRDELHWVNPIKHNLENYNRMFLGVSWSTDNDF